MRRREAIASFGVEGAVLPSNYKDFRLIPCKMVISDTFAGVLGPEGEFRLDRNRVIGEVSLPSGGE